MDYLEVFLEIPTMDP